METHWNPNEGEAPPDFLAELYGVDSEQQDEVDEVNEELDEEYLEELDAEYLEELDEDITDAEDVELDTSTSLERRGNWPPISPEPYLGRSPQARRSRSNVRSPEPLGVVVRVYDEAGAPLDADEYHVPDSHALYHERIGEIERGEIGDEMNGSGRGRSVRGRGRGVRRGLSGRGGHAINRGTSRQGRGGGRPRQAGWQPGQPLEEIWFTDDDVPHDLRQMARDVVRRRQEREEVLERQRRPHARNLSQGENSESEDDDVFEDAFDGRDYARLEGEDLHFEWSPMETFRNVEETFIPEATGSVSSYTNPYDAFRSFWGDDILQIIVDETNRYASRITSATFQADWYATNADELLCLFAFWIMTGVIRMPTICSYFSTYSLLKTEVFSRITTLKKYTNLNRALHFVDTPPASNAMRTQPLMAPQAPIDCNV